MSDSSIIMRLPPLRAAENVRDHRSSCNDVALSPIGTAAQQSCDDVRDARIHQPLDLVLEHQLLPLEARDLELIAGWFRGEKADSLVQIAVLGLEHRQD